MIEVVIKGSSLNTNGFVGNNAPDGAGTFVFSGIALNSFGFVFACSDLWDGYEDSITTVWDACLPGQSESTELCYS